MRDDNGGWLVYLLAAVVVTLLAMALCGCMPKVEPTDRANGMPLDACTVTEYDRPVWLPYCDHAYKVYDRQTGSAWWLLVINEGADCEGYVVLPLAEADR